MTKMMVETKKEKMVAIENLLKEWGFVIQLKGIEEIWEIAEQVYEKRDETEEPSHSFGEYFLSKLFVARIPLDKSKTTKAGKELFKKEYPLWFLDGIELGMEYYNNEEVRCFLDCNRGVHAISRSSRMETENLAVFEEKMETKEYLLLKAFDSKGAQKMLKKRVLGDYISIESESIKSNSLKELTRKMIEILNA